MSLALQSRLQLRSAVSALSAFRSSIISQFSRPTATQKAGIIIPTYKKKVRRKIPVSPPSLLPKNTHPIIYLTNKMKEELDPTGWRRKLFERSSGICVRPGDVIRVIFKDDTRNPFTGTIMGIKRAGLATSVRVRSEVAQIGVELSVKVYSPSVENFEFISRATKRARRAKLYYLRPDERK
ncbi:translation protein SH3-like domain-containing protein [Myxozyma melibiosi]|uniref:Translation protein SH3-like domain-containing protein n=1 Tax=Myxozyma melibiosi TaxID=54550 RepID=A0ABR1F8T4_9ASCO